MGSPGRLYSLVIALRGTAREGMEGRTACWWRWMDFRSLPEGRRVSFVRDISAMMWRVQSCDKGIKNTLYELFSAIINSSDGTTKSRTKRDAVNIISRTRNADNVIVNNVSGRVICIYLLCSC